MVALKHYMINVAAGAGANGWIATLVKDASGLSQQQINDSSSNTIDSITDLTAITNAIATKTYIVKSYYHGLNIGGGILR